MITAALPALKMKEAFDVQAGCLADKPRVMQGLRQSSSPRRGSTEKIK